MNAIQQKKSSYKYKKVARNFVEISDYLFIYLII